MFCSIGAAAGRSHMSVTHQVLNQTPPLEGFTTADEPAVWEALTRYGAEWGGPGVAELGALAGSPEVQEWARLAEAHPPVLHTHDRYGHRIDQVEYHPAYHQVL